MPDVRPVLLYDGECGFCTRSIELVKEHLPSGVSFLPYQTVDLGSFGVSVAEAAHSVQLVDASGRVVHGSAAFGWLLVRAGAPWSLLGRLLLAPPVSLLAEAAYRAISVVRHRLLGSSPAHSG